jgi:hypothetical protein
LTPHQIELDLVKDTRFVSKFYGHMVQWAHENPRIGRFSPRSLPKSQSLLPSVVTANATQPNPTQHRPHLLSNPSLPLQHVVKASERPRSEKVHGECVEKSRELISWNVDGFPAVCVPEAHPFIGSVLINLLIVLHDW